MKLFDRVEILINTETVPRGSRGIVVDVLEPDGCCVEFFDDDDNTIDVLTLYQRDLALVQLVDRDAVRAERERMVPALAPGRKPKGVANACSQCGTTDCCALEPEQVALDMAKLHAIIDHVLGEDPHAGIHIRRGGDNEFMVQVECDDVDVADRINFSRECNRGGIWFGATARDHSRDDLPERDEQLDALARRDDQVQPELTLSEYLLSAPRGDELDVERSRDVPGPAPFAERLADHAEPRRTSLAGEADVTPLMCEDQRRGMLGPSASSEPLDHADALSPLARDYIDGRAAPAELLAEMEAAQLDIIPEDDEQECEQAHRLATRVESVAGVRAEINSLDQETMDALVSLSEALNDLTQALEDVDVCAHRRQFEEAANLGYQSISFNYVFLQRTLGELNALENRRTLLVQSLAEKLGCADEEISAHVNSVMESMRPAPVTLPDHAGRTTRLSFDRVLGLGSTGSRKAGALVRAVKPLATREGAIQLPEHAWDEVTREAERLDVSSSQLIQAATAVWIETNHARFDQEAEAVVLRCIAGHDWGWLSRADERMHLQTVGDDGTTGPIAKVWLEDRGVRSCQPAVGDVDFKQVAQEVQAQRPNIEARWIAFMIRHDLLRADLSGHIVTLTAYPSSQNSFKRTIDLKIEFPGAYNKLPSSWDVEMPLLYLDPTVAALAVGTRKNPDDRDHIDLTQWMFVDPVRD